MGRRTPKRSTDHTIFLSALMSASIVALRSVSVLDVQWGRANSDNPEEGSDLRLLLSTARLRVVYNISLP